MSPLFLSIAKVLVTEIGNQSNYSSSYLEVIKILSISTAWVGGLVLWIRSNDKHKAQIQQLVSKTTN